MIYLLLSEKKADKAWVPCWLNYFDSSNSKKEYIIGDNLSITFSRISENGIRYAVIPFSEDVINILKSDNVFIAQEDAALDVARLNCILVW